MFRAIALTTLLSLSLANAARGETPEPKPDDKAVVGALPPMVPPSRPGGRRCNRGLGVLGVTALAVVATGSALGVTYLVVTPGEWRPPASAKNPYLRKSPDAQLSGVRFASPDMSSAYLNFFAHAEPKLGALEANHLAATAGFELTEEERRKYPQFRQIGTSGRYYIPLAGDIATLMQPGDVLLDLDALPTKPTSESRLAALASGGAGHAMLVTPGAGEGQLRHEDSPAKMSGTNFNRNLHIFRLRSDYVAPDGASREEVLRRAMEFSAQLKGNYEYDRSFRLDLAEQTPEQFKADVQAKRCKSLYCSELPYSVYSVAGVKLQPEGVGTLAREVERGLGALPVGDGRRQAIRAGLLEKVAKTSTIALTPEMRDGKIPLDQWWDGLDGATQKSLDAKYPMAPPGYFMRQATSPTGAFTYVGTYVGPGPRTR